MKKLVIAAMMLDATGVTAMCAVTPPIVNGEVFPDTEGNHINAHGGAIMEHDGTYYWYGEHRGEGRPGKGQRGVACYTSTDLRNWTNRGIVLSVTDEADSPIEEGCGCFACRGGHSRAYIRHLFRAREMLGMRLAVAHNLYFYNTLMERIREALDQGRFDAFYREMVPVLGRRI